MADATDACPRCGEQDRLGTWCGGCGALLEEVDDDGDAPGRRAGRIVLLVLLLAVLTTVAAVVLSATGVYDPLDLGIDLGF